jgi:hypothetical protein
MDGRGSVSGRGKRYLVSRPTLRPIQPPLQWIPGAISPGVNRPGHEADHSHLVQRSGMVELYLHSSMRLHGMVPNLLSRGTFLPFSFITRMECECNVLPGKIFDYIAKRIYMRLISAPVVRR